MRVIGVVCLQDLCRAGPGYPRGTLCAGSRLAAKAEFDEIRDRYSLADIGSGSTTKLSTPSGHRGNQLQLHGMYANMAEINLIIADTKQASYETLVRRGNHLPVSTDQSLTLVAGIDFT